MSKTTHIICILDESGSMAHQRSDVISNFNSFLEEQKSVEGKAKLTLVTFNSTHRVIHDKVKLKDVPNLTEEQFYPRDVTAMNDAIGTTLTRLKKKKKAIVLIHTDGYENASNEFSHSQIKELVESLKKKWEFIFVGGGIDAKGIGNSMGISNTLTVTNDSTGNATLYRAFSTCAASYRSGEEVDLNFNSQ